MRDSTKALNFGGTLMEARLSASRPSLGDGCFRVEIFLSHR